MSKIYRLITVDHGNMDIEDQILPDTVEFPIDLKYSAIGAVMTLTMN